MGLTEATIPWLYPQRNLRESMQINGLNIFTPLAAQRCAATGGHTPVLIFPANLWVSRYVCNVSRQQNLVWEWLQVR